jgi:glycosyltransferase involved in cell wall biosynthesis
VLREDHVELIHLLANSYSVVPVYNVASELGIPYFLTIHDDLEYAALKHPLMKQMTAFMGKAWREAEGVFVISEEMGQEYSRRYGVREYRVVTDGLKQVADVPQQRPERSLRLYFMGLFHNTYAQNLRAVLDALKIVRSRQPDWNITVTCRCGSISAPVHHDDVSVTVLPFAPEEEVEKDMLSADLLYQPMPFQAHARAFTRFSLSTKMITYLGTGLPIFYHGPDNAAACKLLTRHEAAAICATLDPEEIAEQLLDAVVRRESIVNHALRLARSQFMLADQQQRFWEPILQAL